MNSVFEVWRDSLGRLLRFYEAKRGNSVAFFPKLFLFFVLLNVLCFWWALFTAFSSLLDESGSYYLKLQVPVGLLGALFDALSFFVTIHIIRRALRTRSNLQYVTHLLLDLLIAVLAAFWVLFVFSFSGWMIHRMEAQAEIGAPAKPPSQMVKPRPEALKRSPAVAKPPAGPKAPQVKKPPIAKKPPAQSRVPPSSKKPKPRAQVKPSPSEKPRSLGGRARAYHEMLVTALANPGGNLRYIYFGAIMGASASLPTCVHIYMFLASLARSISRRRIEKQNGTGKGTN